MSVDDQLAIGSVLNQRFRIVALIGAGGMSLVYKALDLRQQEMGEQDPYIALKVLKPDLQHHSQLWTLLGQEAKKSQALSHPSIVNVFDYDKTGNIAYMTMALLRGQSLETRLKNNSLPAELEQRLQLAVQLIDAVIHAHEHGVVHADLKPGNIDISVDSNTGAAHAVIFDFGISRVLRASTPNIIACSPAYATPLTIAGEPSGPYDDAYGLGCVIYMLITGEHPYQRIASNKIESPAQVLKPLKQLNFRQWNKLKQLLLFPFEPNYFEQKIFSSQAIRDPQTAQKQVLNWLYALRESLHSRQMMINFSHMAGVFIIICAFFVFSWWVTMPDTEIYDRVESLISDREYAEALNKLVVYKDKHGSLVLSEDLRLSLINGVIGQIENMLKFENSSYNPVGAKQLLDHTLILYPDSRTLMMLLQSYSERMVAARQALSKSLLQDLNDTEFCLTGCLKGAFFWAAQLKKFHSPLYESSKNHLLQGIVKHYAMLLYQKQNGQAQILREKSEAFFSADQLDQLGVFTNPEKVQAQVNSESTKQDLNAVLSAIKSEILDGQTVFERDISSSSLQWQVVHDYLVAFQSLSVVPESPWRSRPLLMKGMKDYFTDTDVSDWRSQVQDIPEVKTDACQGKGLESFECQDHFATGKSPTLVSLSIDKDQLQNNAYRLAVSRYELSWGDLKSYCTSNACPGRQDDPTPVYRLTQDRLDHYLDWLSSRTGYQYRLLTLEEWRRLADPLGLLTELIADSRGIKAQTCRAMGYADNKAMMESLNVYQGQYDRNGFYNLVDQAPEIVSSGTGFILVPGKRERLRRCRIDASPFEYPYAAYRIVRPVAVQAIRNYKDH